MTAYSVSVCVCVCGCECERSLFERRASVPLSGVQCRQRNMAQTNADGADDRRTSETTIPRRTVDSGSTGGAAPSSLLTPGGGGGGGGGGAAADNARTLQHSPMGMPDVKTSMPHPRKRSVSSDLSPIKRIRSASDAFRFSNPFKKFGRLGLLPFVHKRYINDGTSEVKPWIDQATNTPKLFNKASQRQLSEFREYHQKKRSNMAIPSFLRANAVRFLLKVGDLSLVVQEVLGSGGFGLVFRATIVETAMDVAVKFLLLPSFASSPEFLKARKLPSALFASDTIVQYLALCERTQYDNASAELIIMELADGGDLNQAIIKPGSDMQLTPIPMTAKHARLVIKQIVKGLQNLRKSGFLHRDLKPENLWFTRDGRLVLGDLGCIKDLAGKSPHCEQTVSGTEKFDAPELSTARKQHRGGQYVYDSEKTDVWAVGFIYFQLRSGLHLREADVLKFEGREEEVFTLKTPTERANHLFWTTWEKWQRDIMPGGKYSAVKWTHAYRTEPFKEPERDFLDAILVYDPAFRPTISDLAAAMDGQRGSKEALQWLGPKFTAPADAADFEAEMRKRVKTFGIGKNVITYPFFVEAHGNVNHDKVMHETYRKLTDKIKAAADRLKYSLQAKELVDTPAVIQTIFDFFRSGSSGAAHPPPSSNGRPDSRPTGPDPVLRVIIEVEEPNEEMQGLYSFERRKGDAHVFKSFMRRLRREFKKA